MHVKQGHQRLTRSVMELAVIIPNRKPVGDFTGNVLDDLLLDHHQC